jgi:hypothetical protein
MNLVAVICDLEQMQGFDSGVLCISFTRENEYISGIKLIR